jgi:heme/copper-type cytochrome/quinol oxidase subunit 2
MNGIETGSGLNSGFAVYKIILIAVDTLVILGIAIGAFFVYRKAGMTEEEFRNRNRMSKRGKIILWCVIAAAVIVLAVFFFVWVYPLLVKALKI